MSEDTPSGIAHKCPKCGNVEDLPELAEVLTIFQQKLAAAEKLLKKIEWAKVDDIGEHWCPCCDRFEGDGHAADCELARLTK